MHTVQSFIQRQSQLGHSKLNDKDEPQSESDYAELLTPRKGKVQPLSQSKIGDLIGVRNALKRNVPGTAINGTVLCSPAIIKKTSKLDLSVKKSCDPDT